MADADRFRVCLTADRLLHPGEPETRRNSKSHPRFLLLLCLDVCWNLHVSNSVPVLCSLSDLAGVVHKESPTGVPALYSLYAALQATQMNGHDRLTLMPALNYSNEDRRSLGNRSYPHECVAICNPDISGWPRTQCSHGLRPHEQTFQTMMITRVTFKVWGVECHTA